MVTNTNIDDTGAERKVCTISDLRENKTASQILTSDNADLMSTQRGDSCTTEQTFWERIVTWRFFMVVLLHLSAVITMMPMVTMSMALECMCGPVRPSKNNTLQNGISLPNVSNYTESTFSENGSLPQMREYEFSWDSETRGLLISVHLFTSFLVPQLCNVIRSHLGNKLTLTIFNLTLAFLSFLSPIAARTNVYLFLAVRTLTGFCLTANKPISVDMLAWWIPVQEKLTSTTIVISGWFIGGGISPVTSGFFCLSSVDNGWPFIFYFNGTLVVLWTVAWHYLSSRKPENHSFISDEEKTYILSHRDGMSSDNTKEADRPPYRIILTSGPVLAFLVTIICHVWVNVIIYNLLPSYLTSVLKFSLQDAGVIFCVMSFLRFPAGLLWSALGNWLLKIKSMTTNKVRKICFGLGQGLASVFCLGMSCLNEQHKWMASVLVIVSVLSSTFGMILAGIVPLDMAPRYSGFITGLVMSASSLASISGPLFAAAVTTQGSFEEWRVVWITVAFVSFTAGLVFITFGSSSQQSWAVPETNFTIKKEST